MQPSVRGTEKAPCMFHSQEWAGMSSVSPAPAFFRIRDVLRITALSRPTLYRRIAARRFPPPVHLGGRACGWPSAALQAWITDPEGYCAPEEPHTLVSRKRGSPRKHPVYRTGPESSRLLHLLLLGALRIQVIGPRLHHLSTRLQVKRMIVGCARIVSLLVRELQLDVLMRPTMLVQNC